MTTKKYFFISKIFNDKFPISKPPERPEFRTYHEPYLVHGCKVYFLVYRPPPRWG